MARFAMTPFLFAFLGVVLLASLGAFFLFVPPLLIATVALLLTGILLMFSLGIHLELQPVPPADDIDRKD
jgi:hypothetical protein